MTRLLQREISQFYDEANQTTFTYVSISTSGDDVTDEDKETKKEQAQEILDKMKEDPTADMSEVAQGVDESYSAVQVIYN